MERDGTKQKNGRIMTKKRSTHVRINTDVLRHIREAIPSKSDEERLTVLWRTSPVRFDKWLGSPVKKRKR